MNLPNKLTIFRVILIPFFVVALLYPMDSAANEWIALAIFVIASITDMLDGQIARKYNLVTNFGKFMDPLADKLLVSSALICFIELKLLPSWVVLIIIAREFIISGFRLIASDNGKVIAASWWGKIKTVFQMVTIIFIIIAKTMGRALAWNKIGLQDYTIVTDSATISLWSMIGTVLVWISLLLTVISLVDYIVKNKDVMKEQG